MICVVRVVNERGEGVENEAAVEKRDEAADAETGVGMRRWRAVAMRLYERTAGAKACPIEQAQARRRLGGLLLCRPAQRHIM